MELAPTRSLEVLGYREFISGVATGVGEVHKKALCPHSEKRV